MGVVFRRYHGTKAWRLAPLLNKFEGFSGSGSAAFGGYQRGGDTLKESNSAKPQR